MIFELGELGLRVAGRKWSGSLVSVEGMSCDAGQLDALQVRWMHRLRDIRHQDPIGIVAQHDLQFVACILAVWRLGGIVVPLKPLAPGSSHDAVLGHCRATRLVDPAAEKITCLDPVAACSAGVQMRERPQTTGVDLALVIYTSGSTGKPKGIALSHANVLTAAYSISEYLQIGEDERILCASPFSFDYGLYQLLFCLLKDCHLVLLGNTFNPLRTWQVLTRQRISLFPGVPAQLADLAELARRFNWKSGALRKITNTGGHLPGATIRTLREQFPDVAVYAMYGLTECKRALYLPPEEIDHHPDSVGRPIPGLAAKVVREVSRNGVAALEEVEAGEEGELIVRGSAVMQGYLHDEGASRACLIRGSYRDDLWLRTGDLFSVDQEGFFYFRGRAKELIKQGGFCLHPRDIEAIAEGHPEVHKAVVFRQMDERGLEQAHLVIEPKPGAGEVEVPGFFKGWMARHCDVDYLPRRVSVVHNMPVNDNGKIDKRRIAEMVANAN